MQEGAYRIKVAVKDGFDAQDTQSAVVTDLVDSRVTGDQHVTAWDLPNVALPVTQSTLASHRLLGQRHAQGTSLRHMIAHPCAEPSPSCFPSRMRRHELSETASVCRADAGCALEFCDLGRSDRRGQW
jgi:hypothetical protein